MGILWSKVDINEELNKNKRAISKAIREVDREIQKLQQEEVKLQKEIRNAIEKGYTESAKIFSKDILKIRRQIERLNIARSQLMCAELKLTSVKSQIQVNNTLSDLNNVMGKVNGLTELSSIQNILKNYAKEADKFDVKGDIINDSIDVALGNDLGFEDEDELAEKIYKEVYDSVELGKQGNNSNITKTKNLNITLGKNSDTQKFDTNTEFETNDKEKDFDSCISIQERIKRLGEGRRG
ncbi:hypothetical protein FG379_000227 [Cryptosporidium bovis]|uniref:uncharacterized protein n=1 Tax=Cryptosporidium bovis TaxID=310047 RepID=UPI00351A82B0|nr:hypothetical protein FG379_000227 [Cryptosporidium bovis]